MRRELIVTKDGSASISVPEMRVTYHSIHGAITESIHVFINAGLKYVLQDPGRKKLNILEIGFGTGLNAFLTLIEIQNIPVQVYYEAIDTNPLAQSEYEALRFSDALSKDLESVFLQMHVAAWNEENSITPKFVLNKNQCSLLDYASDQIFDLIYFDAFAPSAQPELWTTEIFERLFSITGVGGVLVTYCAKGEVRRSMISAGYHVEKLPGAPGKREMLRARRTQDA
jgi:tRNA U34 5-methylaminomethyl-2-thiouridine-forming methyltransferase MnmC